jgi:hypothetical protein
MSTASVPITHISSRGQPQREREDINVVRQSEDDESQAAIRELTNQVKALSYILEKGEKGNGGKFPSTGTIVSVVTLALVAVTYIVTITIYTASLNGEIKNQQTQIQYQNQAITDLKNRIDDRERKGAESDKAIQTLREMYFLKFGSKPSRGE